jgi:hypothetical protein
MSDVKLQSDQLGHEKCERLLSNADFQWFMEHVEKKRKGAEAVLRDTKTKPDAREITAHILDALEEIANYVPTARDIYARGIPSLQNRA